MLNSGSLNSRRPATPARGNLRITYSPPIRQGAQSEHARIEQTVDIAVIFPIRAVRPASLMFSGVGSKDCLFRSHPLARNRFRRHRFSRATSRVTAGIRHHQTGHPGIRFSRPAGSAGPGRYLGSVAQFII
jgi:hypothetical protein